MEITLDTLINLLGLLLGGGCGAFFTWRWQQRKAAAEAKEKEAEAKSAEVDMAQKVQDTYQEMLEYKQKEVEDNHRLIEELRQDRDHYKENYTEVRDELEKLSKEFRDFRTQSDEERATMKRDIELNRKQVSILAPLICAKLNCKDRILVSISECMKSNCASGSRNPKTPKNQ